MEYIAIEELQPNPENPRQITQENLDKLVKSLREFPRMLELRPFVVTDENVVLGGNQRLEACKQLEYEAVPVMRASNLTDKEKERFVIADNVPFGDWDWDVLGSLWNTDELEEWGLEIPELDKAKETVEESEEQHNPLNDRFVVPPFSVLDTRKNILSRQAKIYFFPVRLISIWRFTATMSKTQATKPITKNFCSCLKTPLRKASIA